MTRKAKNPNSPKPTNWHSRKRKSKMREIEKRAPHWFLKNTKTKIVTKTVKNSKARVTIEKLVQPMYYALVIDKPEFEEARYKMVIQIPWFGYHNTFYFYQKPPNQDGTFTIEEFLEQLDTYPDAMISASTKKYIRQEIYIKQITVIPKVSNESYNQLRRQMDKERHWYSGMVQTSTGRTQLHSDLKKITNYYNVCKLHN